jgi:hypothetical protein
VEQFGCRHIATLKLNADRLGMMRGSDASAAQLGLSHTADITVWQCAA